MHDPIKDVYGLKPGDTLLLHFPGGESRTLTVVGLTRSQGGGVVLSGMVGLREAYGIVAPGVVPRGQDPLPSPYILQIDANHSNEIMKTITVIDGLFSVETSMLDEYAERFMDQFLPLPILIAALALFTSSVIIANSVALAMLERRRQVGILKAIGLQTEQVLGLLVLENVMLGLLGGGLGAGLGAAVVFGTDALGSAVSNFPMDAVVLLVLLSVGLSFVATVVSAVGPASERPLDALRYE